MKKLLYFFVLLVSVVIQLISCKDDSNEVVPATQLLLTKVVRDGVTELEFTYDTEKKLVRSDSYNFEGEWSSYTLYEYNDKGIAESRRYGADDHTLSARTTFSLDNFGRIHKSENYSYDSDFKKVYSEDVMTYDPSGRLTKGLHQIVGSSPNEKQKYTYDPANHRTSRKQPLILISPPNSLGLTTTILQATSLTIGNISCQYPILMKPLGRCSI
jgi:hypothetical protein